MKIKKLIALILSIVVLVFCFCIAGCNSTAREDLETVCGDRFGVISVDTKATGPSTSTIILYDKETKVMYLYLRYGPGGGLVVMVDEEGKPLLYEGE